LNERKAFLKALADNEDNAEVRMTYADWLDARGEHEEAERQSRWPVAKQWIIEFCDIYNPPLNDDYYGPEDFVTYHILIERGMAAVKDAGNPYGPSIHCCSNENLCDGLAQNKQEFWKNWSIITGIPVPEVVVEKCGYTCAC